MTAAPEIVYRIERQATMHPTKCWVVRAITMRAPTLYTHVHGPFNGGLGYAAAQSVIGALNSFTLPPEWDQLTERERAYITKNKDNPERPGLDNDEIPF